MKRMMLMANLAGVVLSTIALAHETADRICETALQPEEVQLPIHFPANAAGTLRAFNKTTSESVTLDKGMGDILELYWTPAGPPDTGDGEWGDEWPEPHGQNVLRPGNDDAWDQGRVNNLTLDGNLTLEGFTWDGNWSGFALKLVNCGGPRLDPGDPLSWPTIDFVGCTFTRAGQGFASNWDVDKDVPIYGLNVRFYDCHWVDCYTPGNSGRPAEVGIFHNHRGTRSLIGVYGSTMVNMGYDGSPEQARTNASYFDHGGYADGNPRLEIMDSLFVSCSAHAFKGPVSTVKYLRNAVVDCAIGFSAGMDLDQQNETGRYITTGTISDNVFYGLRDLPLNNQRLAFGLFLQSCDVDVVRNVFTTPNSTNQNQPAIRIDRIGDRPVTVRARDNVILGYRHFFEVHGNDRAWTADVSGEGNELGQGCELVFNRKGGSIESAEAVGTVQSSSRPASIDVDALRRQAVEGTTRADEVRRAILAGID